MPYFPSLQNLPGIDNVLLVLHNRKRKIFSPIFLTRYPGFLLYDSVARAKVKIQISHRTNINTRNLSIAYLQFKNGVVAFCNLRV